MDIMKNTIEPLVTAKEAIDMFQRAGYSASTFRKRVKDGRIERHLPEHRQRGARYPQSQILAALEHGKPRKQKKRDTTQLEPTRFLVATPDDMPEVAGLLETFFRAKINVQKRTAWILRNPEIVFILRSPQRIVGCAFVMPLSVEKIMDILARDVQPPTRPDELLLYAPNHPVNVYIRSVGVLQSVSKRQRKHWAAALLLGLLNALFALGARGIPIEHMYAQGDTKAGERALRLLGFTQIISVTTHKNFVMDMQTSGTPLATKYRKALDEWTALYGAE